MIKPTDWHLEDSNPQGPLEDMHPLSLRARSLLARSTRHPNAQAGFLNILGGIDMMRGMTYHHENFLQLVDRISKLPFRSGCELKANLIHETVAYVNRLGQFYHFASSSFVSSHIPDWELRIPTISKFKRIRDKHTAHRSLDKPRRVDTPHMQEVHAWAMSSIGGLFFEPKPEIQVPSPPPEMLTNPGQWWKKNFVGFQMLGDFPQRPDNTINFSTEKDHPILESECYGIIECLLK
jgi:hypothetical protein